MTLHPDVERWLAYLEQRGRAATTLRTYRSIMGSFVADPAAATLDDVEVWWATQDGQAATTRNRTLSCVRSFYLWAVRFDVVEKDPSRRLDPPHKGSRLPRPIGRSDLLKILAASDEEMRRAVCLGAYAGLRVSEAAALRWPDIDLEARRIMVRGGKGDKDRAVGLSALLLDELLPNAGGNVVTGRPRGYSTEVLTRKVNRLIDRAGVDATFHKLRARFATKALAGTGNLLAVSRSMGHANVATTAIYAATSDSDLDLIADAVTR